MKDVTQDYIDSEEASERKPVEIYKVWRNDESQYWYYTSGDISITYDSDVYAPTSLKRSQSKYDTNLEVTAITITTNFDNTPTQDFLSINPIDIIWVQIMKLHREQAPLEADVIFIGQIKGVTFKGVEASVQCVGFEHFLKKTVPTWRYQLTCNHQVFDSRCGLTAATYKVTDTVTLDSTKTVLTGTDFGTKADGYFIGGEAQANDESRTIVAHVGTAITIAYKMNLLENNDSVDAYPGCDQRAETCRDKFASTNILNFLGTKDIPIENPATRVTW